MLIKLELQQMFKTKKWHKTALLSFLLLAALISTAQGFYNALQNSHDFQWSPSVLFWEGINPYTHYLSGNENNKKIFLLQFPNYAHITYIALFPFTLLDWEAAKLAWALTNLCLAILIVRILCNHATLYLYETLVILSIFLCSTPFRQTVGAGQHALVVLLFFCAILLQKKILSESLIGIGFFKYSFIPPVFLYLVFSRGIKLAIFSSLPCIIGWLLFSFYINDNPFITLTQPLKVNDMSVGYGKGDIMTFLHLLYPEFLAYIYPAPILLSFLFAFFITKSLGGELYKLAMLAIACLATFKHLGYDFVMLLPAFVYAFKNRMAIHAKLAIGIIFFIWFGFRLISPFKIELILLVEINFFLLLVLAFLVNMINKRSV